MALPKIANRDCIAQIVVFGDSGVGKTCFIDMFVEGRPFILYSAVAADLSDRTFLVEDQNWSLWFIDLSSTALRDTDPNLSTEFFDNKLSIADGIVLLYDITSKESFDQITEHAYTYAWACRQDQGAGPRRFGCVLVGNKADIVKEDPSKRQVSKEMAEQWAQSQGYSHFEVCSKERAEVEAATRGLVKSMRKAKRMDEVDSKWLAQGKSGKAEQEKGFRKKFKDTIGRLS